MNKGSLPDFNSLTKIRILDCGGNDEVYAALKKRFKVLQRAKVGVCMLARRKRLESDKKI